MKISEEIKKVDGGTMPGTTDDRYIGEEVLVVDLFIQHGDPAGAKP